MTACRKTVINCRVNGEDHTVLADPRDTLLELLRDRLQLTGTKEGCGNGNCGSCTVIADGKRFVPAWSWPAKPMGSRSPPSRALPRMASAIPCNRR